MHEGRGLAFLGILIGPVFLALAALGASPSRIEFEEVGEIISKARLELGPLSPGPDGPVQLVWSFPETNRLDILAVNLSTGSVTNVPGGPGRQVWRVLWGRDRRLYLAMNGPPHLLRWDPSTQRAEDLGLAMREADCIYSLAVATDGQIVGGGCEQARAFRFDPKTRRLTDYGWLGPPRSGQSYTYSVGGDDTHLYGATGKMPWVIMALEASTGRQVELLRFAATDFPAIHQQPDAVYLRVSRKLESEVRYENYRLKDGRATPVSLAPNTSVDLTPFSNAKPSSVLGSGFTASDGRVPLSFRAHTGDDQSARERAEDWRQVWLPAPAEPLKVGRILARRSGTLVGHSRPYGPLFAFDPRTGSHQILGPVPWVNVYSLLEARDGLVYFSGYPSASLNVYDPRRPWTTGPAGPGVAVPDEESAESNPRRLLYFSSLFSVHTGMHLAEGADGRIFVCAEGRRHRVGGALGWYDPRGEKAGGLSEPALAQLDCAWLASASNGSNIVYSSVITPDPTRPDETPKEAVLFVYDVRRNQVTQIRPLPGLSSTGPVAEGRPGEIVGAAPDGSRSQLYVVDLATRTTLRTRAVDGLVGGGGRDGPDFRRGPEGSIWTFVDGVLCRIDPDTLDIARIGVVSGPDRAAFLGSDLYLAGANRLRRHRGGFPSLGEPMGR